MLSDLFIGVTKRIVILEDLARNFIRLAVVLITGLLLSIYLLWSGNEVAGAVFGTSIIVTGGYVGAAWFKLKRTSNEDDD